MNERKEKQRSWHWTNIWPWVPAGPDARCERAGWLPAVTFCFCVVAYRQVSSAKRARWTPCVWGASFIYILKRVGDKTEPCGTPACITLGVDISPSTETLKFFCVRKEPISLIKLFENSNLDNFYSKPECHVLSQAFSMSKNTAAVDILLLKLRVKWSVSLMHCSIVLWRPQPNWLALSRPLSLICFWRVFRITFSNSLPLMDRRLIGRKFLGNFGSLPGFGNVVTFASFQDFGKWDRRRQL
jgi:hypothetical protein